ncbi:MAG: hypothetical protein JHC39_11670 [Lentimicrobium sp.]|jgi:uncharacterized membrane protein|nr:hypothetical protein [Lentimicrobium sp.]
MHFKSKSICAFLIFTFLLQSCTVYQKTPVSISEAITTNNKVVITKTDFTKHKFRRIEQIEGQYYGVIKSNGNRVNVPLIESDIKSIRILDEKKSKWKTAGVIVAASIATLLIASAIISTSIDNSMKHIDILPY